MMIIVPITFILDKKEISILFICRVEISQSNYKLERLVAEYDRLRATKESDIARFGISVPAILKLIDCNAEKFNKKPLGPLGKVYIS